MKEKKFGEFKIEESLSNKDDKYEELKAMLALFNDMSSYEAKEYLEGMKQEINLFLNEENKNRSLGDLKIKWLDEYAEDITKN